MKKLTILFLLLSLTACTGSKPEQPTSPTDEKGLIYDGDEIEIFYEEDFCYTNTKKDFTVWLGMSKKDGVAALGKFNRWKHRDEKIYESYKDGEKYYGYNYYDGRYLFDDEKLISIGTWEDTHGNWKSYRGINEKTSQETIIKIFGQPTHHESSELTYLFYSLMKIIIEK